MKKIIGCLIIAIVLVSRPILGETKDFYPKIFADINREAKKSVVQVLGGAYMKSDRPYITAQGAGFFVGKNLILTSCHVVAGTPEIRVKTLDGKFFPAKVVVGNPSLDIAVIKIDSDVDMPALKLGDSSKLEEGEIVMAIGHPLNLTWSVSVGVISALRIMAENSFSLPKEVIQTDVAINSGNSGGPLLNLEGEAIGIVSLIIREASGIALAIPINAAKELLALVKEEAKMLSQEPPAPGESEKK